MRPIPLLRRLRLAGLMITVACTVACVEWRAESPPVAGTRAANRLPSRVRIETRDGRAMTLWNPSVRGDSIYGQEEAAHNAGDITEVGVALANVQLLEARRPSPGRSVVVAMGVIVATILFFGILLGGEGT